MSKHKKLEDDYFFQMEKVLKQFKKFSQQEMSKRMIDISPEQWSVLLKAYQQPGISQRDIANSTYKDPASVTRMIDILEEKKLLSRKADSSDRRSHDIVLSEKGKEFVKEVLPLTEEMKTYGLRNVSSSDQKVFVSVLARIFDNLE